jgi:membrane-associated protease RseP (regulator of RpoE activity)
MLKRGLLVLGGVAVLALGAVAFSAARAQDDEKDTRRDRKVVIFRSGGSWLGVQIADVDDARAREIGLKETMGAEIQSVSEDSPADEAGLKKGDVIVEYQGTRIEGVAQLTRLVRETPAGRNASLRVWSGGATRTVQVKVGEREPDHPGRMHWKGHAPMAPNAPDAPEAPEPPMIDIEGFEIPDVGMLMTPYGRPRLGAVVDTLGGQLAEYFGVKQGGGVLVKSVKKGGPGDTAGLRAGDVIVRVDDVQVEDEGDLRMAIRERRGKEFKVTVVRERREQTLTIPAPPDDHSDGRPARRGMTPGDRERIRRQVREAMKEASVARAQASEEVRRAYQEAVRAVREQLEDQVEAVSDEAVEEGVEENVQEGVEEAVPDDVESIRNPELQERDDIRRAVEEARRVRIEMQQLSDE